MKKLKVSIYYSVSYGRNDGAPLYYYNVLKNDPDVEVLHLTPKGDVSEFGKRDVHLWVDWGEDGLPWEEWSVPKDGGKTVYVASDTHLGGKYRMKKAKQFDYAFFNQKQPFMKMKNSYWLPHAFEPQAYPVYNKLKKYDVCFIGHLQEDKNINGMNRVEALDVLFKAYPNFYFGSREPMYPGKHLFEDVAHRFSESKVVFNISIKDDINMRVFETLGTKSFLLTNKLPHLDELFVTGQHLETYETYKEMIEKVRFYLDHEWEREKIAEAGHQEAIKHHTYKQRWETIKSVIKS
jgi:hypothetical protein